jgi:bifunctional enzyme CysN/CysC
MATQPAPDTGAGPAADSATRLLESWLAEHERKSLLRFLTCGSVDDGKSTLIGRLLLETQSVPRDVLAAVERDSRSLGSQGERTDLAFLTDGLKAEREQGITIDVAYRSFATERRRFIIADTPGHEQYTRNMATGASTAELAVILIDARHGVTRQTRRHACITSLLGIRQVIVAVNKMDLVGYDRAAFERVRDEFLAFAAGLEPRDHHAVPISALEGDCVTTRGERMPWYGGPTVLELLETLPTAPSLERGAFRFPVQLALRPSSDFRGFAGSIASGRVRVGDRVAVLPSGRTTTVARIATLDGDLPEAVAPMAVVLAFTEEVDCGRGDLIAAAAARPGLSNRFDADLVWFDDAPLVAGREYLLRHGTLETPTTVVRLAHRTDLATLAASPAPVLEANEIGRVELRTTRPLAFDPYRDNRATGAFILVDRTTNATCAAGMIVASEIGHWLDPSETRLRPSASAVTTREREGRYGQRPATILLTGLSGSGKSAVARAVERLLFDLGRVAVVLDGEGIRAGLSRDLGFSAADRSENLRRAMEVARTLNESGLVVVASFVAPQEDARRRCRELVGSERFLLVHCAAPLEHCRRRDPSGVYRDAERGLLRDVPGLDLRYEEPTDADLVLPTHERDIAACAEDLVALLRERGFVV